MENMECWRDLHRGSSVPGSPEKGIPEQAGRVAGRPITVSKYVDIVRVTRARLLMLEKGFTNMER